MPKDAFTDSESKLHTIVESTSDGLIVVNKDGVILFFNEAVMFHLGRKREELLGKPFGVPIVVGKLTEIDITRTETDLSGKGIAQMAAVEIEWEKKPAYLVTIHDVTELKEAERLKCEISEYKRVDQLKSEFVGTVSHELRTPLTTMKEFVSIVLDEIPGKINKEQKEYLNIVQGNIDRLARIIANLLDISKIEAKKMELKKTLVNIETLVKDVVSGLKSKADAKHITMETLFPRVSSDVYIDSDRITQIFTNLIDNAIKFTPEKGKIVVEIKAGKKEIECSVSDTGIGIAPENRDKLFEKFVQIGRTLGPGAKGTGLGLAIIKDLVQLHNGKIWVESELDKGSKFIFTLPKIKVEEIFKEYIINGLKEAADRKSSLSLIVVHIVRFSQLQEKWGEKPLYLLTDIERVIKGSLRRKTDTVLRTTGELAIPLPDTRKEDAEVVKKRIEEAVRTYLSQCQEEWIKEIRITVGSATYPEDAGNDKDLIDKAKSQLEFLYTGPERRKYERKRIEIKIGISCKRKDKEAKLDYITSRDLGEEGLGLYTKDKLKPGTKLFISIQLLAQKIPLEIEGEVIWSKRLGTKEFPYRTGVKFVGQKRGGGRKKSILELIKS